ncbi:MAG: hypothetical protein A2509_01400 [Candidatus Edwardsbacteria bacterium RIFOXYD12_FULL_50_11]|uniref:DUF4184 domain-containing protein n=1 Tax=Candidatus Edwardsbacteria bacterium GWF2_54_11 TaxID=1817851 RepID=A0A1F5RCH5_9BACT|nr:MAG: hypothetical protein A2502_02725 [Candidatus Edwardsbacteria bacterium RifOxyC12_full_54_24]OGF07633.1 MAG: hypothetical protein A2273_03975 [Candidatus Edwardsbacteria bacterium RifOxyA12_full_54_48]OGF09884.1 MAG: hypothetical protein A3K15_10385 [Candidatus Edwardsbacteria bacterium GWE2_54_12]OGF12145.1 MAG: hypothetical protein A2024_03940 [Candidatus Edwardsbacteria bacterium GWF2_54_11]OGF16245.1 MAG: hypothetical protein A2509_01400 [Candidatus Edwardsbacteria bacterium RIFOXYD1
MPFTAAHPAMILPIKARWPKYFSLTALVVGSMAPDFEFFIRFYPLRGPGHTLLGSLYFNLPLVFLTALLFHYVVKKPLIYCLPGSLGSRFYAMAGDRWSIATPRNFLVFTYSALAGMLTHFFLDAFTHPLQMFRDLAPVLMSHLFTIRFYGAEYKVPAHNAIHLAVTAIGLGVILYYIMKLKPAAAGEKRRIGQLFKWAYWGFGLALAVAITVLRTIQIRGRPGIGFFEHYGVTFLSGLILGFLAVSLVYRAFREFR